MGTFAKHRGDTHDQSRHRSNFGKGTLVVPNYICIVGDAVTKGLDGVDTIQVLIKDDAMAPMYWRSNVAALVKRVVNQNRLGKPVSLIFRPEGPGGLPHHGAFDLILRQTDGQASFRKSATVTQHDGVMVAFHPDPTTAHKLAVPGGLDHTEHHVTLAYLGKAKDFGRVDQLHALVKNFSRSHAPVIGRVGGVVRFNNEEGEGRHAFAAHIDAPGIHDFQKELTSHLMSEEFYPASNHSFTPHMTLKYLEPEEAAPFNNLPKHPLNFSSLHVHVNDDTSEYPLRGTPNTDDAGPGAIYGTGFDQTNAYAVKARDAGEFNVYFTKAVAEQRYTLGVLYKASRPGDLHLDAHGEFTTADELQKSQWKYVRSGNRRIYLQHGLTQQAFRQAGEWVDLVQWPFELNVPFHKDGQTSNRTIPAGSLYMGVVWEPWAWGLVKNGDIRGFSFGGRTDRVTVSA